MRFCQLWLHMKKFQLDLTSRIPKRSGGWQHSLQGKCCRVWFRASEVKSTIFFFFFWQLLKSFKRKSFKSRIYLFLNPLKERGSSVTHFHQGHWNQRLPWPHNFTGHPHPLSDLILSFKVNLICIGMECKWSASNKVLLAFLTLALKSKSNTGCQKDRMPLKCWEFGTLHVSHKNVSLPSLANRNL